MSANFTISSLADIQKVVDHVKAYKSSLYPELGTGSITRGELVPKIITADHLEAYLSLGVLSWYDTKLKNPVTKRKRTTRVYEVWI